MNPKIKNTLKYVLSFVIAGVLLYFSFRSVDWHEFLACLKACQWEYVALTMFCCAGVQLFRGLRYKMLINPIDPSVPFSASFNSVNIGMLANIALPRAGELIRCGYVTRHSARGEDGKKKASYDKVIGTVVVERAWDILFGAILIILVLFLCKDEIGDYFRNNLLGGIKQKSGAMWIGIAVVLLIVVLAWAIRHFRDRNSLFKKIDDVFQGIGTGLTTCLHMEKGWLFVLYTVAIWILYWGQSWFILMAMKRIDPSALGTDLSGPLAILESLGPEDALFLMLAGSASSLIPAPGGFGAYHGVVAGVLSGVYAIPFHLGLLYATLAHESVTLTQALMGLGSFIHESIKKE